MLLSAYGASTGVIVAICSLLTFPSKDIWVWSVQALYNLTCISDVRRAASQSQSLSSSRLT